MERVQSKHSFFHLILYNSDMEYIKIGKIVNTHGIKGELKIQSYSDFDAERYQKGNVVFICFEEQKIEMHVKSYRVHKGFPLVSFEEGKDINDVEKYKNCDVMIQKSQRKPLTDGRHYISDLIGMSVEDENGNLIGELLDVEDTIGANRNMRIKKMNNKECLVPYISAFVKNIDEENQKITIHVIEGLL